MAVGTSVSNNNPDGVTLGIASTDKVSFWGATPVVQPTNASLVAATDAATVIVLANGLLAALNISGIIDAA